VNAHQQRVALVAAHEHRASDPQPGRGDGWRQTAHREPAPDHDWLVPTL